MKKYLLIALIAGLGYVSSSCSSEDRCVSGSGDRVRRSYDATGFRNLEISGSQEFYISKGSDYKVEIEAQPNIHDRLDVDVHSGTLSVEVDGCIRFHKSIKVYITTPELEDIELSGSADVYVNDEFTTDHCRIDISGSGEIHHRLVANELDVNISGSGEVEIEGAAEDQDIRISGSGDFYGFDLPGSTAYVQVSGSGDARVNVSDFLEVHVSGSGNVYYKGSPQLDINITGSGTVQRKP